MVFYTSSHAFQGSSALCRSERRRMAWPWHTANRAMASSRSMDGPWRWWSGTRCSTSHWNLLCFWARSDLPVWTSKSTRRVVVMWLSFRQPVSPHPKPWRPITRNSWMRLLGRRSKIVLQYDRTLPVAEPHSCESKKCGGPGPEILLINLSGFTFIINSGRGI